MGGGRLFNRIKDNLELVTLWIGHMSDTKTDRHTHISHLSLSLSQGMKTNCPLEPVAVILYVKHPFLCITERQSVCSSRCCLWPYGHAPVLLPSGWLSGAGHPNLIGCWERSGLYGQFGQRERPAHGLSGSVHSKGQMDRVQHWASAGRKTPQHWRWGTTI